MKNMYIHHAHISEEKTRCLIECFALDMTGTQTAALTGLNLNTVYRIFNKIRTRILEKSQASAPMQGVPKADAGHGSHIAGTEAFRDYAGRRLAKFKGIPKAKLELHLKETEFRFGARGQDVYLILLKELRDHPLN